VFVIGFDDAIADPIAEVARLGERAVVEPIGQIGLVLVGDERCLNLFLAAFRDRLAFARLATCWIRGQVGRFPMRRVRSRSQPAVAPKRDCCPHWPC
jgi:hypothetical protein